MLGTEAAEVGPAAEDCVDFSGGTTGKSRFHTRATKHEPGPDGGHGLHVLDGPVPAIDSVPATSRSPC